MRRLPRSRSSAAEKSSKASWFLLRGAETYQNCHTGSGHSISPLYMPSMEQQECLIYPPMIQLHVHLYECTYIHIHTYIHTYIHIRTDVHIRTYVHVPSSDECGSTDCYSHAPNHTHTCTKSLVQMCEDTYIHTLTLKMEIFQL